MNGDCNEAILASISHMELDNPAIGVISQMPYPAKWLWWDPGLLPVDSVFSLMGSVRLFTYGYGHSVQEVLGSLLDYGTKVGVFHPSRQLARFSPRNMPYILSSKAISAIIIITNKVNISDVVIIVLYVWCVICTLVFLL